MTTSLERHLPVTARPFTAHLIVEPEEVYATKRKDFLSSHRLADFRKCPRIYQDKVLGLIEDEDRPAFQVGRAVHCRVLEGAAEFHRRFAIGGPINPKTDKPFGEGTKAYSEWAAAVGKPAVSQETADLCELLADAVGRHAEAATLLAKGQAEGVVRAEIAGVPCQGRLDWTHPDFGLIDLKTIDDLDWLEAQARSFGYAHQLAFYRSLLASVTGRDPAVHLIAVEKKAPYRVGVWRFSDQVLNAAGRENLAAIERLKRCQAEDRWPTGYEGIRTFDYIG